MNHLILYETLKIKSGFFKCRDVRDKLHQCLKKNSIDDCKLAVYNYKKCLATNEIPYHILKKSKDTHENQ